MPGNTIVPGPDALRPIEEAAVAIAREGGALILDRFRSTLNVEFKGGHKDDPVTEVDRAVEAQVLERVKRDFPDHAVLGEEGTNHGAAGADFVWAIDPLDGTTNFINGLGIFCCSIGVLWRGMPVVGAVFLPSGRHAAAGVYHARRGGGAFFEDEEFRFQVTSLPVGSRVSSVPAGLTGVDGRRGRHQFGTARTLGSCAAELVLTADGTFQVGVFHGLHIWDVAAGAALCQRGRRRRLGPRRRRRPLAAPGAPARRSRPRPQPGRVARLERLAGGRRAGPAAAPAARPPARAVAARRGAADDLRQGRLSRRPCAS